MKAESFADVWKELDDFQRSLHFWEVGFYKCAGQRKRICLKSRIAYDIKRTHCMEEAEAYGCDLELKEVMYKQQWGNNEY